MGLKVNIVILFLLPSRNLIYNVINFDFIPILVRFPLPTAVNCYYHIDKFMKYMDEELGITIKSTVYTGGVRFDPSGYDGSDNSHYVMGTEYISFGEGGVDDAEDADVIIHELGHLIHHWLTGHGRLNQVHGLSEVWLQI